MSARESARESRKTTTLNKLERTHPDLKEVLGDAKFIEWVRQSPVRMELFQRADQDYDFDAGNELISSFKERRAIVQQTAQAEQHQRDQQARAAQTGSASGAISAGSKRIFRRADIIKLMKEDPARYEALGDVIMAAYREGRVR